MLRFNFGDTDLMPNTINRNKIEENLATGQQLHCKMGMLWVTVCDCMLMSKTRLPNIMALSNTHKLPTSYPQAQTPQKSL